MLLAAPCFCRRPRLGRASPLRLSSAQALRLGSGQASAELRLRTEPVEVTGPAPTRKIPCTLFGMGAHASTRTDVSRIEKDDPRSAPTEAGGARKIKSPEALPPHQRGPRWTRPGASGLGDCWNSVGGIHRQPIREEDMPTLQSPHRSRSLRVCALDHLLSCVGIPYRRFEGEARKKCRDRPDLSLTPSGVRGIEGPETLASTSLSLRQAQCAA